MHNLSNQNVAAIVVLYNPEADVYDNIMSYYDQVDAVILVDNSDIPATDLVQSFSGDSKVISISNIANSGIAAALNQGARAARVIGCTFVLTMDQDSRATSGMVDILKSLFSSCDIDGLALAAPFHLTLIDKVPGSSVISTEERDTVWTSGNLLSLAAFEIAGPFEEKLFIDFVDHEYCLRLKRLGFRIVQSNKAILYHGFGNNLKSFNILSRRIIISNHTPLRRYYITRNRLWVASIYPEFKRFVWFDRLCILTELITILIWEDNRCKKYKMMLAGVRDYLLGKMGKFENSILDHGKNNHV